MNLQSIADIHDEISVLMPSGMLATLCVCDDGIIVDYGQGVKDTYSTDEFGKIVADGIQVFEKPSQMVIEDFNNKDHIEKQNKLDRIVKCNKDAKNRQIARGLLDRLNLGANDDKEIEKFVKKANKNEKLEIKRNKTMDIKDMNKVLESYINEISDETVNKVADKRKHNFKKAERNFSNAVKKAWKNTENIKDSEARYNKIMNQTDKTEKKYAQANQKLQNNKLLNKLRDRRKEQPKNESYIVREMIGNYSTVVGRFDLFDEAQDFLMDEWYKYAEENNIDLDNESEQQNFFSYYSLEETKNESKINENWKDYDYQYLSIKQALNDIEDEYTRNKYLQDFEGLIKRLEYSSKNENKINEISDELKGRALGKRIAQARKANKKFMNKYPNNQISIDKNDPRAEEWLKDSDDSMEKTKKARRLYGKVVKEAFEDNMLTDINDLDFPQALQDTVETDDEGELITLGKVADEIKNLKDELVDEIKDIKDDLKDEINDIKQDMQDEISDELSDEELADIEDIEFEDVPMEVEETEEIDEPEKAEKEEKETDVDEKDEEDNKDEEDDKEDKIEESFKKYITKGKYEDLAQTKREVDKLTQQGKDAKEIKDTITLLADDEKEEDEAEKYAVSKLKESLLATSRTSTLNNL